MGRYISPEITRITDGLKAGPVPQDPYTEALVVTSALQDQIDRGVAFFTNANFDLTISATKDILVVTPASSLIFQVVDLISSTLEAQLDVYLDTTFTATGTASPTPNRNGLSSNTATIIVYHSPTVNVLGTSIYTTRWGTGNKVGAIKEGLGAIFNYSQNYHFRLTSKAAANNITHELYWTEDINRNP